MGNPDTSYWGTSAATACPLSTMIAVAAIGNVFIMMISTTVVAEPCRDTAAFAAWVLQIRARSRTGKRLEPIAHFHQY